METYFKEGDVVKIRADLNRTKCYKMASDKPNEFDKVNTFMLEYSGKVALIEAVFNDGGANTEYCVGDERPFYRLDIDSGAWFWVDEMFENFKKE